MTGPRLPRLLAVHPASRGFGWVVFEGPYAPVDWGFAMTLGSKNEVCVEKVDGLITKYLPEALILEAFEPHASSRSERIARLGRALTTLATERGIDGAVFGKHEIKACFQASGAHTRHEIAKAIVRNIPVFEAVLPPKRKFGESEKDRTAIFSAAALAMTHYYLSVNTLFGDLKGGRDTENPTENA